MGAGPGLSVLLMRSVACGASCHPLRIEHRGPFTAKKIIVKDGDYAAITCEAVKVVGALTKIALNAANDHEPALDVICVKAYKVTDESGHATNALVCNSCCGSIGTTVSVTLDS